MAEYQSNSGLVIMSPENFNLPLGGWKVSTSASGYTGTGYIENDDQEYFQGIEAGHNVITVQIKINTPGKYRFQWRTQVLAGTNSHDNNDTWLRFPDADDFYGETSAGVKGWPRGANKSPVLAGQTDKGWMKLFLVANLNQWTWTTRTNDEAGREVYVEFDTVGVYHMEIATRSLSHGIDRAVLWNVATQNESAATQLNSAETTYNVSGTSGNGNVTTTGELKNYHKTTLNLNGPYRGEQESTFKNLRFNVTFTSPSNVSYLVPGYFAADGNSAETSATEGNQWKCHFLPTEEGVWTYVTSFRSGVNVSTSTSLFAGAALAPYDNKSGSFTIAPTDKIGTDLRAKGKLQYVNETFLQWSTGEYFYKVGCDSPETILEMPDIDNTFAPTKTFSPHLSDWNTGDPDWQGGKGRSIVGAMNYLAEQGQKVQYFMIHSCYGDGGHINAAKGKGGETSPWIGADSFYRYDTSKLAQWQILFDHMASKGLITHLVLSEQENQSYFEDQEGGSMANGRKLYFRELVARFGYLNGLTWNIGEESGWTANGRRYGTAITTAQQIEQAAYLDSILYYKENIVLHNGPSTQARALQNYNALTVTQTKFTGAAYQGVYDEASYNDGISTYDRLTFFRQRALNNGQPWVISYDEPWNSPKILGTTMFTKWRKQSLWNSIMAGAAGIEMYIAGGDDLIAQDLRPYQTLFEYMDYACSLFMNNNIPLQEMIPNRNIVNNSSVNYAMSNSGQGYLAYFPNGGTNNTLTTTTSTLHTIKWYNPRTGGSLQNGSITTVNGGTAIGIGNPPNGLTLDWVAYVYDANIPTSGMNGTPTVIVPTSSSFDEDFFNFIH